MSDKCGKIDSHEMIGILSNAVFCYLYEFWFYTECENIKEKGLFNKNILCIKNMNLITCITNYR